jgi:hypothetical protein
MGSGTQQRRPGDPPSRRTSRRAGRYAEPPSQSPLKGGASQRWQRHPEAGDRQPQQDLAGSEQVSDPCGAEHFKLG